MVGLFGEHESCGAGQGIKARLGQGAELELTITVGEIGEHVEREPVGRLLVKRPENTGVVLLAAAALKQCFCLLATIQAKMFMQKVDHGPEVTALFHIHMKEVA